LSAPSDYSRRSFLRLGLGIAASSPLLLTQGCGGGGSSGSTSPVSTPTETFDVAIVASSDYGQGLQPALASAFDLLGGIGPLVQGKTVTVKINLTNDGTLNNLFGNPPGESYITHPATAIALASLLFQNGATRVRFVDSVGFLEALSDTLIRAQWDVPALLATGNVELENTRNLGIGTAYAQLQVPAPGYLFDYFQLNHSYQDSDVFISLAKLKQHLTAGVTLTTKCIFGITPNSLYGTDAVNENAIGFRGRLHGTGSAGWNSNPPPGAKSDVMPTADAGWRIPRIVADASRARPAHLVILDGISSMSGGEGPWAPNIAPTNPDILIVGRNSIATDAVGVAVMGFPNPQATRGTQPFSACDNHLLLAQQAGFGTADLAKINVLGLSIPQAAYPYPAL
jgi:uncharacterized protein (DUF362 family)